jgi:DNA-binding beta-propeller fold protein YncE
MTMHRTRPHTAALVVAVMCAACGGGADGGEAAGEQDAAAAVGPASAAAFEVDPGWPQEMPDLWVMGSVTGVFVDDRDHVWVTHLPETLTPEETSAVQDPPIGTCCRPAPAVVEFDPSGAVVQAWGYPDDGIETYPRNPHGIFVDHEGFVWIGTYRHHRVQKFTRTGELVLTIGEYDVTSGSDSPDHLGGPAGIWVDPASNEVFIADGYRNRRVVVFDGETGEYLRHWGAYGEAPDDSVDVPRGAPDALPREFATVHGIVGSADGLIYVADRRGNRVQVFERSGAYVSEVFIAPETLASGSSFVPVLSRDPEERWLYLADGTNHVVWVIQRSDLEVVGSFGRGGRQVGQFLRPHGMGIDSDGNLYVGEASTGRRIQKFIHRTR